jgi:hypothetical protein
MRSTSTPRPPAPAVQMEYWYSAIFISLLKKSIGGTGFRFVPLDSPMLVVSVILFKVPSRRVCGYATLSRENGCTTLFWRLTQCIPLFYHSRPTPSYAVNHFACLYSVLVWSFNEVWLVADVLRATSNMENPGPSSSADNTYKNVYRNW